jgi:hypothetical protein
MEGLFKLFLDLVDAKCRHHQHGRWQARIGRVSGNKDLYLGTFSMQQLPTPFLNSYSSKL